MKLNKKSIYLAMLIIMIGGFCVLIINRQKILLSWESMKTNKELQQLTMSGKEIVRDVNLSNWKKYENDNFQFKYPQDIKLITELRGDGVLIKMLDKENNQPIGFIRIGNIKHASRVVSAKELLAGIISNKNTFLSEWKMNRINQLHQGEEVGYIKNNKYILPWTVVGESFKKAINVHAMSDITIYNKHQDSLTSLEVRVYGGHEKSKDILYGILKSVSF